MRRIRNEEGAALILALAFLTLFGLWIATVLGLANTSTRVTENLRTQRATVYAPDGATDGAIQYVRGDPSRGAFGTTCPPYQATVNNLVVSVTCQSLAQTLDLDRTVQFTASVGGTSRVVATVIFRDSAGGSGAPAVDVVSWRYSR